MKEKFAQYSSRLEGGEILCELCPHRCKIPDGKTGICGVRRNYDGKLISESYGRVTSMALDPIEKKPLYHFYPGAKILSMGGYGCNFRCGFCQNHEISMGKAPSVRVVSPKEVADVSKELEPEGNIGVAYTYNEPLIGYEFVQDCAKLIAEQEQKNVLVTNGFICPEPLEELLRDIHAMNIDLKSFNPAFYKGIGGCLGDVQRSIEIAASRCHLEVTTLVIPGKNDSDGEMHSLAQWLAGINKDIPLHISRFFPHYKMQDVDPTPVETVCRLAEVAKQYLNYVHLGNC